MTDAVAGVVRQGKRWHSRVESANAETSTHLHRVPTAVPRAGTTVLPCPPSSPPSPTPSPPAEVEIVDLTARLSAETPIIALPPEFGQTQRFELDEISRYDDRGPAWYWNNFRSGEHTGTHLDAPNHWVTGRDGSDVADIPVSRLIRPVVVLDFSAECAEDPDFLLEVDHIRAWETEHGALPDGGWMIYRTGWDARSDSQERFINASETGPHTPGMSIECARWVAEEAAVVGRRRGDRGHRRRCRPLLRPALPLPLLPDGQRQVRPDPAPERRAPAHHRCRPRGRSAADRDRFGVPRPRDRPRRALTVRVSDAVGQALVRAGIDHVFGVVGSGNFHVTNAMVAAGARFVAARHEGGATTMADAYARVSGRVAAVTVHQGCGLTNTMTGLAEAAKSRTPLVVVAAEATEPRSNFYVDQPALARAVGAVSCGSTARRRR